MKKIVMKKVILLIIILAICYIPTKCCAGVTNPVSDPNAYNPVALTSESAGALTSKAGVILGAIRNIGIAAGIIILSIIGLKYMFGSVEEKAEYKKTLLPFVIGAIMLMAGTTLVSLIYGVFAPTENGTAREETEDIQTQIQEQIQEQIAPQVTQDAADAVENAKDEAENLEKDATKEEKNKGSNGGGSF